LGRGASENEKKPEIVLGEELQMAGTGIYSMSSKKPVWVIEQSALVRTGF
jgi:hypothetical protein